MVRGRGAGGGGVGPGPRAGGPYHGPAGGRKPPHARGDRGRWSLYRVPTPRPQPSTARPTALVVSDSALGRLRLQRRLRRAGTDARAVDPWAAEADLTRDVWDVVVWASTRHERLARSLVGLPGCAAALLVVPGDAPAATVASALDAGFADAVREGTAPAEVVARAVVLARRARGHRALSAAAEAFRELAEGSRDLLMRVDAGGTVVFASAASRESLGREPRDLEGRRLPDLCHPKERARVEEALEGDADPAPFPHRLRARTGEWVWMETTVRAVRDPTGRLRETHTDSRDVTDRMRDDAEREALARVTAAVAAAADVERVAAMVAREAAALSGAPAAEVVRFHGDEGLVVGASGAPSRAGDRVPLDVAVPDALAVPVAVEGRPWGLVRSRGAPTPRPRDEERLRALADLVALAVANANSRRRLVALATTDPLTGLANHRTFHDRLGAEAARSARGGTPLGLVLIDLDHFKRVNDTHGHQAGDDVLREVARRLRGRSRREDVVARVGGEELAWLLPGAGVAEALEAAERLRGDIRGADFPRVGRVTASMGVAEHADDGPAGLLRRADLALYRAKAGGRDACVAGDGVAEVTAAPSA